MIKIGSEKNVHFYMNNKFGLAFLTSGSAKLIINKKVFFFSENPIKNYELQVFTEIKKQALKYSPFETPKRINYFQNNLKIGTYSNMIEIDLNQAYFKTARNLGIVDEKTFNKFKDFRKEIKLKAVGNLAKSESCILFNKGEKIILKRFLFPEQQEIKNHYRRVWENIVHKCDSVIKEALQIAEFGFVWVDQIYLFPEHTEKVKSFLINSGYEIKIKSCKKITVENKRILVYYENEFNPKIFNATVEPLKNKFV